MKDYIAVSRWLVLLLLVCFQDYPICSAMQFVQADLLPDDHRYLASVWNFRADTYEMEHIYGGPGSGAGQLLLPGGLDEHVGRGIYTVDSFNSRILFKEDDTSELKVFHAFDEPVRLMDLAVSSAGDVAVLDQMGSHVIILSADGNAKTRIGRGLGTGIGFLNEPAAIAISPDGIIWVADSGNDRITAFSPDGRKAFHTGRRGRTGGTLNNPHGIAISPAGNLLVSDTFNHRIEEYYPDGHWRRTVYTCKDNRNFFLPGSIDSDPYGNIYVVNQADGSVIKMSADGEVIARLGAQTNRDARFILPAGICVTSTGALLVADRGNHRITAWHAEHFSRGIVALLEGDVEKAEVNFTQVVRINPENPNAWYYLGRCLEYRGSLNEAVYAYRRAYGLSASARSGILSANRIRIIRSSWKVHGGVSKLPGDEEAKGLPELPGDEETEGLPKLPGDEEAHESVPELTDGEEGGAAGAQAQAEGVPEGAQAQAEAAGP